MDPERRGKIEPKLVKAFGNGVARELLRDDAAPKSKLMPYDLSDRLLEKFLLSNIARGIYAKASGSASKGHAAPEAITSMLLYEERILEYSIVSRTNAVAVIAKNLALDMSADSGLASEALALLTKFCDKSGPLMTAPEAEPLIQALSQRPHHRAVPTYFHLADAIVALYQKSGGSSATAFIQKIDWILDKYPIFTTMEEAKDKGHMEARGNISEMLRLSEDIHKGCDAVYPEEEGKKANGMGKGLLRD